LKKPEGNLQPRLSFFIFYSGNKAVMQWWLIGTSLLNKTSSTMAYVRMFGSTIFWSYINKIIFGCFIMLKGSSNIFNGLAYGISGIRPLGRISWVNLKKFNRKMKNLKSWMSNKQEYDISNNQLTNDKPITTWLFQKVFSKYVSKFLLNQSHIYEYGIYCSMLKWRHLMTHIE